MAAGEGRSTLGAGLAEGSGTGAGLGAGVALGWLGDGAALGGAGEEAGCDLNRRGLPAWAAGELKAAAEAAGAELGAGGAGTALATGAGSTLTVVPVAGTDTCTAGTERASCAGCEGETMRARQGRS